MHLKEISFFSKKTLPVFGNSIKFVFQEDDNTFWDFCFSYDNEINIFNGSNELFIHKYIIDDENEKHVIIDIDKYCNKEEGFECLMIAFEDNCNPVLILHDYIYDKKVDKNGVTDYNFNFFINNEYKTISINSSNQELSKSVKNNIQRIIKQNVKNKWNKIDDPMITCKVPVDVHGYNVNGKFYKTLKQAAKELNVSISVLSKSLNERSYSSSFNVYPDMITEYSEEKHRLSYAILNMYDIVSIEDIKFNCNKIDVKLD